MKLEEVYVVVAKEPIRKTVLEKLDELHIEYDFLLRTNKKYIHLVDPIMTASFSNAEVIGKTEVSLQQFLDILPTWRGRKAVRMSPQVFIKVTGHCVNVTYSFRDGDMKMDNDAPVMDILDLRVAFSKPQVFLIYPGDYAIFTTEQQLKDLKEQVRKHHVKNNQKVKDINKAGQHVIYVDANRELQLASSVETVVNRNHLYPVEEFLIKISQDRLLPRTGGFQALRTDAGLLIGCDELSWSTINECFRVIDFEYSQPIEY